MALWLLIYLSQADELNLRNPLAIFLQAEFVRYVILIAPKHLPALCQGYHMCREYLPLFVSRYESMKHDPLGSIQQRSAKPNPPNSAVSSLSLELRGALSRFLQLGFAG